MSEQARIETAIDTTIDNCEVLRARLAKYEDADGNPKAQPSGVVHHNLIEALKFYANGDHLLLADPDAWDTCSGEPINFLHDDAGTASFEDGSIAKAALDSLNSSPASAGDDAQYPPCDYCAEPLSYHPWHGSGLINGVESRHIHACDKCRHLLPTVSAGDDRETIRAVFLRNGFTIKEGQADLKPYVYAAAGELMSIARAALSAPSHGEQVREWVPVSERLPETKAGTNADFIVAIRRAHNGKTYVVPASFLNRFELYSEDEAADDEGRIYVTGWYREMADDEYDTSWHKMETEGDLITHWQELPASPSAGSQKEQE